MKKPSQIFQNLRSYIEYEIHTSFKFVSTTDCQINVTYSGSVYRLLPHCHGAISNDRGKRFIWNVDMRLRKFYIFLSVHYDTICNN